MWPGAFQLSIWFKFEKRNSESHTRVRVNAIVVGYVNCVNYRMYWIVHTTATLSKLYTKPMLQRVFNQRGGKMLQLLGRVLSTSIHATSHQCQWRRNWVGARVDDTLFSYLSFRHTRTVCTFSQHAQCVMSITEHFNYNNCDCPPECDTISELSNNIIERLAARTLSNQFHTMHLSHFSLTFWFRSIWPVSRHEHAEKRGDDDIANDQFGFACRFLQWNTRVFWIYGAWLKRKFTN